MLTIGITGHRILDPDEKDRIIEGINCVFNQIRNAYQEVEFTVLSPLAEGADCLFAAEAINQLHAKLIVPLPLPVADYLQDFTTEEAKAVFFKLLEQAEQVVALPPRSSHPAAYREAGKYIVSKSDLLVAVWDGLAARSLGGTGDIVRYARQSGLPLAWIPASNLNPVTMEHTHPAARQRAVVFERFPGIQE